MEETAAVPEAQSFQLKTPLLPEGRTNKVLAQTDSLKLRIKVYAEGGENGSRDPELFKAFSGGAPLPPRLEIKTTRSEEKPTHRNGRAPQGGARHSRRKISVALVANRPYRN